MAGIDMGGGSGRRSVNRDVPLIPFIDFLLCLVAFLLVTAVWSENARLEASAQVPGVHDERPTDPKKQLHVKVKDQRFELSWRQGSTVISSTDVPRTPVEVAPGVVQYPVLAERVGEEWRAHGVHRAATDRHSDVAILHTDNATPFGELTAVMDALHAPRRKVDRGGTTGDAPAFAVSFATN